MSDKRNKTTEYFIPITGWPEGERPREKLAAMGEEHLSDAELIAILIRTGMKHQSALDIAKRLLSGAKSLTGIAEKSLTELQNICGIGSTKAITLKAAFEIGKRVSSGEKIVNKQFKGPSDVANYFIPILQNLKKETFRIVLLDTKNRIIKDLQVSEGGLNMSVVHPREVFKPAIAESAAAIIAVHNHPSGDTEPSKEDIVITKALVHTGETIGIPMLDHIIIAGTRYCSLKELGYLSA